MTTDKCEINKVSIIIESVDSENASVKLITDPVPADDQEIADTPAVLLASDLWVLVEDFLGKQTPTHETSKTLQ